MKKLAPKIRSRLRPLLTVTAILVLNSLSALAQSTSFSSTDLKTGISNSLAVIMMFGFVLGISSVIYGGFAIRRGDVDQGKMSIIGGLGAGIIVFFVQLVILDVSLAMSFLAALVPVLVCLAYIFALRQGKPPGYDRDCFEYLMTGCGFGPQAGRHFNHPLL